MTDHHQRKDRPKIEPLQLTSWQAHSGLVLLVGQLILSQYAYGSRRGLVSFSLETMFYLALFGILSNASRHRIQLLTCISLVVTSMLVRYFSIGGPNLDSAIAASLLTIAGMITLYVTMRRFFATVTVAPPLITGAVSLYILSGTIWFLAYSAVHSVFPTSFRHSFGENVTSADVYYFSFVTLTTLGYGDITPATSWTRSLAMLQAVFGQVFLVVLLGRLVSLQVAPADATESGRRPHQLGANHDK